MEKQRLIETLQQLHDELSGEKNVDPETLALMRTVTDDLDRLLDQRAREAEVDAAPVTSGLRNLVLKFEADHPELSISIGKVADALAAMGI
jgi:hypothetical protein